MNPPQSRSVHARDDYASLEDNTFESLEHPFNIPDNPSTIFSSSHQQGAVDLLHHPGINTLGVSGSALFNSTQVANEHESMNVTLPIVMDDIDFDSLVDWSGNEPSPIEVDNSGINNLSDLDQLVFSHGDQNWGLSQYSGAISNLHQTTPYSLEVVAINQQNPLDFQSLTPIDITQQSSVQEPTTSLWPSDSHSTTFLGTDNANATTSESLPDQFWIDYNIANAHGPQFHSSADSDNFQQIEIQGNNNHSLNDLIDYPEAWSSFPRNQTNTQLDNTVARFGITSQAQHSSSSPINKKNYIPIVGHLGESQAPSRLPILPTTTQIHQITREIEEFGSVVNPIGLKLNTQSTRQLPKARKGGRRGPLTKKQVQSQRAARVSGVCIRCRKTKIKCTGGIPCDACRATSKSRIWKTPCTKAQFLDIVESGSYFPLVVIQEILYIQPMGVGLFAAQLSLIYQLAEAGKYASLTQLPWKTECEIPWSIGREVLGTVLIGICNEFGLEYLSSSNGLSTSRFVSSLNLMVNEHPSGEHIQFSTDISRTGSSKWTHDIITFCMACPYLFSEGLDLDEIDFPADHEKKHVCLKMATATLKWIAARYLELCLFRYLQDLSNDLTERPTKYEKEYIICMFQALLLDGGISASTMEFWSLDANDPHIQNMRQTFLDRQTRLRMALWVYSSIAISKLPPWSNIWTTLQERWPLLSGMHMAQKFHSSLVAFDTSTDRKIEPIYESFEFLNEYTSAIRELYERIGSECCDYQPIRSDEEMVRYRLVISDHLDNIRAMVDQHPTTGALSAEAEKQQKVLSVLAFTFLANVKWEATLPRATDIQDAIQTGKLCLYHLVETVAGRLYHIGLANAIDKFAKNTAIAPSDAMEVLITCFHTLCIPISGDFSLRIRIGRRWKKLKSLFGPEIILLGSSAQLFRRSPHLLLDIPGAVEAASDEQFSELTKIMDTEFRWLKDTCAKLNVVYGMIGKLNMANEKDEKAIADQIQFRINTTFGNTMFTNWVIRTDSTLLDPFPSVFRTRKVLMETSSSAMNIKGILDIIIERMAMLYWNGMPQEEKEEKLQILNEALTNSGDIPTPVKDWVLKVVDNFLDSFDIGVGS